MLRTHFALVTVLMACAPVAPIAPIAPVAPVAPVAPPYTMRVDYFHSGGPAGESVKLDRIVNDGVWAGSQTQLIDDTNLGKFFFEVIERDSGRVLYSRGFASIYGEWETTPAVRSVNRTFHESLRFPWPAGPVRVVLKKRDDWNVFRDLWVTEIDPHSHTARRTAPRPRGTVSPLFESGPPNAKVDVLLISDRYGAAQLWKFRADASRLVEALFALEPFRSRRSDFNVRLLSVNGSAARVEFNIFGIERYALTYDNKSLRNVAGSAPYDVVEILVDDKKYGGGGIFNQQSTVAAANASAEYVFIHEFAHNFAALADEYVGSVTYETANSPNVEPWEPNITALLDPASLKWRDLVEAGTPIPTPLTFAGKVGAFEGAGYEARGLYRPEAECIMGTRKVVDFCRVCQRAISRMIDLHTR